MSSQWEDLSKVNATPFYKSLRVADESGKPSKLTTKKL